MKPVLTASVYAPFLPDRCEAAATVLTEAGITVSDTDPDVVVAIGGDGTFLKCFNMFETPVLAVNAGHLGFLSSCGEDALPAAAKNLASGDYHVHELPLLSMKLPDASEHTAVNDVCVHRCSDFGLLHMGIEVNGQTAAMLTGDGVLVSTPSGSTAYSLSCGGPILHPNLSAMVITPVCPHLLSLRPIVIPLSASVSIRIHGPGDRALVSPDGRAVGMSLGDGDGVTVCRASRNRLMVSLPDEEGYYVRLGRKLGWSFRG